MKCSGIFLYITVNMEDILSYLSGSCSQNWSEIDCLQSLFVLVFMLLEMCVRVF